MASRAFAATRSAFSTQAVAQTNPFQAQIDLLKTLSTSRKNHLRRIKACKVQNQTFDFISEQLQAQRRAVRAATRLPYPSLSGLTPYQRSITLADYYKRNRALQKKFPSEISSLTSLAQITGSRSSPVLRSVPSKKQAYVVPDNSPYKYKTLIGTPKSEVYRDAKYWDSQPNFYERFSLLIGVGFVGGVATSSLGIEF